jgi:predicted DNA-binding protein
MPKKTATTKEATSIRLTPEAKRLLATLAEKNGVSQAAWMEMIIRKEARREKISLEPAVGNEVNGRG